MVWIIWGISFILKSIGIIEYSRKLILGQLLIGVSEIMYIVNGVSIEVALGIILVIIALMETSKKRDSVELISPGVSGRVIIYSSIVTLTIIVATSASANIGIVGALYIVIPVLALVSAGIRAIDYLILTIIHCILWGYIGIIGCLTGNLTIASVVEPTIYIIFSTISLYTIVQKSGRYKVNEVEQE